jgi:hypothetical protein
MLAEKMQGRWYSRQTARMGIRQYCCKPVETYNCLTLSGSLFPLFVIPLKKRYRFFEGAKVQYFFKSQSLSINIFDYS